MRKSLIVKIMAIGGLLMAPAGFSSCVSADAANESGYVYICTGPKAKVYHSTPECSGLKKCSGTVKKVQRSSTKRRGCRKCT